MLVAPAVVDERRVSRKLTINLDQNIMNVRPIVKGTLLFLSRTLCSIDSQNFFVFYIGAIKEAAYTLTDAYAGDAVLRWCARGLEQQKQAEFLYTLFKNMINSASLQSRDFAVQVDGCKGVLVWTTQSQGCPWPYVLNTKKLASFIGWTSALRAVLKIQPACDKMRRKVMAPYPHFITIGYIGVLPHEQRKGLGSALLQHVIDKADQGNQPVCVQVNDDKALKFFAKFGFNIEAEAKLNGSTEPPVYLMVRHPVALDGDTTPRPIRIRPGRQNSDY